MIKPRRNKKKIDWDNIKVTFVRADKNDLNPLNPNSKLTPEQRKKKFIEAAARLWRDKCDR